jgi:hypothetical protein
MNWTNFVSMIETAEDVPNDYLIERIRNWRNAELVATDWTQLSDAPADKAAYAIYRQELRDLLAQSEDARVFIFPIKP